MAIMGRIEAGRALAVNPGPALKRARFGSPLAMIAVAFGVIMLLWAFDPLQDLRARLRRVSGDRSTRAATASLSAPSDRLERSITVGDQTLDAFRVRFSQAGEPTKGGVRFDAAADLAESERLALLMSLKCALVGLPFGGAKGAVRVEPDTLEAIGSANVARAYAEAFRDVFGPDTDVPAPDIATGPDEMAAMAEALNARPGRARAPVTGLPDDRGGLELRTGATGRGAWRVFRRLCRAGACEQGPRIALQGFGKAGRAFAEAASKDGATIVAISDSRSLAAQKDGLDLDAVAERKAETGRVGEGGDPSEVLRVEADILALAARSDVVTAGEAARVRAPVLIELANAPVTGRGYRVLEARGRWSAPDLLANAGGVIASYLEWREHAASGEPDDEALQAEWAGIIDRAADAVIGRAETGSLAIHAAALELALEQLDPKTRPQASPGTSA